MDFFLTLIGAYLLGSLPFGLIIARIFGLGDVRNIGSGNIGATNVLRTGNKFAAALTLLFDMAKGFIPVICAPAGLDHLAACAAVIGHCFPIWLKFKGGKGVATYLGALFGLSFLLGIIGGAIWVALAYFFRFSSISSISMALLTPFIALLFGVSSLAFFGIALSALITIIQQRGNIERLLNRVEPKIGDH